MYVKLPNGRSLESDAGSILTRCTMACTEHGDLLGFFLQSSGALSSGQPNSRDAPRVKNPGGQVVLGGDNVSPLVEIGLTDPPKSGGAAAPPASHLAACLHT